MTDSLLHDARRSLRALALDVPGPVWDDANKKIGGALDRLEKTLAEIADPSYVGNYDDETVVNIYRSWAHNALVAE